MDTIEVGRGRGGASHPTARTLEADSVSQGELRIRVALVEPQKLVQTALASLVEAAEGLQMVATAQTIADGLKLAEQFQPDIVLMSISGEWGVFAAVAQFSERCPRAKVILLDERALDANVREALRVNSAGYLTKEQPFHQIESALRRAMNDENVYAPVIADRLVLSTWGVRLAADNSSSPLASLTPREIDVLIHLAQGYSVKQCAKALGIGTSTAGNHKSRLMKKLQIHKTVDLTRLAIREGLVPEGRGPVSAPHFRDLDPAL